MSRSCSRSTSWSTRSAPGPRSRSSPAVVGWFMVLRAQTFAGPHARRSSAFPGAAGAVWLGREREPRLLRVLHRRRAAHRRVPAHDRRGLQRGVGGDRHASRRSRSRAGLLFVSLYAGFLNGVTALLFGNFLGITDAQVVTLAVIAVVVRRGARASCTGRCCSPRSIPTSRRRAASAPRVLSALFLVVLGVAVAEAAQITGALLVFALLVVPAAAAQVLTARPGAEPRAGGRVRARRSCGSASRSRTTRRTRSGSGSPRSRSRPTARARLCARASVPA